MQYANNVCAPLVSFTAAPTSGRQPLVVSFQDLSSGAIERREWDFGDGTTSGELHPEHVYNEPGEYTVRLRVWGPGGGSGEQSIEDLITVQDPVYSYTIPDQVVTPGSAELWVPVLATFVEPIDGFQVFGTYDPSMITILRSDLELTALRRHDIEPDLFLTNIRGTSFDIGCLFETEPPFDRRSIPPGPGQRLVHLICGVPLDAPQGATSSIRLFNDARVSKVFNVFVVGGQNRLPALNSGTVHVRVIEPPFPRVFLRGDFDGSGSVNLSDAIAILAFLFQAGKDPACADAADVRDEGRIDISGAIFLLNFLFAGGTPPAIPYPNWGLDGTPDKLGDCTS